MKKIFYSVTDVCEMLEVSTTKGYQIIRQLNRELQDKGYITIAGKVNKKYFDEKYYQ